MSALRRVREPRNKRRNAKLSATRIPGERTARPYLRAVCRFAGDAAAAASREHHERAIRFAFVLAARIQRCCVSDAYEQRIRALHHTLQQAKRNKTQFPLGALRACRRGIVTSAARGLNFPRKSVATRRTAASRPKAVSLARSPASARRREEGGGGGDRTLVSCASVIRRRAATCFRRSGATTHKT